MIYLTRLNGKEFVLNAELIEFVEATPDVVITLINKNRFLVQETLEEVISRIMNYRNGIYRQWPAILNFPGGVEKP